ncbi:uncharacterized protein NECHADRAFT_85966 [Fusarium vanettenii 77-13-4]|uniref:Uncharacterized protein n=1 Tax=Fusarium vanettenii (strain ATCC MYA-4622 / CBS 123669 / FGSC 9596 / NRRL 45880 / 77-13-4) TaxID=660122 RepID=C7Z1Z2_FUSV7|nr:uncharacterized protein NECHADRAFT_85966 [Fusarium vanettenii 77-13-4]EEU41910.1 predicted protein [Fusarium vanettenii 77-13-4]
MSSPEPSRRRTRSTSAPPRFKTFQVIKPFTIDDYCYLKEPGIVALKVGYHGIIAQSAADGSKRYPPVRLLRTTKTPQGLETYSALHKRGEEFNVPRDRIKIGSFVPEDVPENVPDDQRHLFEIIPKDRKLNPRRIKTRPGREEHTWIRTTQPAKPGMPECWVFRTAPRRISSRNVAFQFVNGNGESRNVCRIEISPKTWNSLNLNSASLVNRVVEITVDGQRHPFHWRNIPAIGPFDCWAEALRVAVCIEYMDADGHWKKQYFQSTNFKRFSTTPICRRLHERGIEEPFKAVVRIVEFNFLDQRFVASNPSEISRPCPRLLSLEETEKLIRRKLGTRLPLAWKSLADRPRRRCDLCITGTDELGCNTSRSTTVTPGGQILIQCKLAKLMMRYCTFNADIGQASELQDLAFIRRDAFVPQSALCPPNEKQHLAMLENFKD